MQAEVLVQLHKIAEDNNLIVAFGNDNYFKIVSEWIRKIDELGIKNYVVIANDEALYSKLHQQNKNVVYLPYSGSIKDFWVFRLQTIYKLVCAGFNILHSDADAYWLKDPRSYISSLSVDVASSQGSVYPLTALSAWGVVLCCGFQVFNATTATVKFLSDTLPRLQKVKDDQVALNEELLEQRLGWDATKPDYTLKVGENEFNCFKEAKFGVTKAGLTVALLPHRYFQRVLEQSVEDIFVAHPLSAKTEPAKLESLSKLEKKLNL